MLQVIINDCPIAVGVKNSHKFWMCRSLSTLDKLDRFPLPPVAPPLSDTSLTHVMRLGIFNYVTNAYCDGTIILMINDPVLSARRIALNSLIIKEMYANGPSKTGDAGFFFLATTWENDLL
jgi:hypothetical protein